MPKISPLTLGMLLVAGVASADIVSNLAACWNFDEGTGGAGATTADASGNGNTCTLGAGATNPAWVAGILGPNALDFDGSDDRLDCGTGATLTPGGSAITVAARVNKDVATTFGWVLIKSPVDAVSQYSLQWRSIQRARFLVEAGGSSGQVDSATNLNAATTYSIVGVYNGTDMRMYINGVLDSTPVAKTGALAANNGQTLLIGISRNTSPTAFGGIIDDVRLWGRALSAGDVSEYHSTTSPCGVTAPRRRPLFFGQSSPWRRWLPVFWRTYGP